MRTIPSIFGILCLAASAELAFAVEVDPKKATLSPDGNTLWFDGKSLIIEGKGWSETRSYYERLPAKAEGMVTSMVWGLGQHSAGLCIRFSTDAPSVQVRWSLLPHVGLSMEHMPATGVSGIDLYSRGKSGQWLFVGNGRPSGVSNTASFQAPCWAPAGQPCMLYLPLYNGVTSLEIGIPKGHILSVPDPAEMAQRKPIVFYGTSITQGGCASRPGMAFTSIVGRRLDVPVINLGFSGSGVMEPAMSDLLAELDPAAYVLDSLWNMSDEMVEARVEPFVRKLRAAHPSTPIWLAEDSNVGNLNPTSKGLIVRKIRDKLLAEGFRNLHFISNLGMLGEDTEGTVDTCHPNDLGMMRQADAFTQALAPILLKRQ